MKITYKLYTSEHIEGLKLAEVYDKSQAYVLKAYYKQIYNDYRFKVTEKEGRKKEEIVCGFHE